MRNGAVAALLAAVSVACSAGVRGSIGPSPLPSPAAATPTPAPSAGVPQPLEVVRFAVLGTLVSAEVRNPNRYHELGPTRLRVVVRDRLGGLLTRSPVQPRPGEKCCTLFGLRPLASHGVYVDAGPRAARAGTVEVELLGPEWRRTATGGGPEAELTTPALHRSARSTWVTGRLGVRGLRVADVAVQAVLEDPAGNLVAVISAVVGCVGESPRRVRVELFHAVPEATVVAGVHLQPFPRGSLPSASIAPC